MCRRFLFLSSVLIAAAATAAFAQRPRAVDPGRPSSSGAAPPPAPQTVKAKYEGGVFGFRRKQEGTLAFDDANSRLVFRNNQQKEVFFIRYEAIQQEFSDTQSRRPRTATVLGSIPTIYVPSAIYVPNPIGFIRTKNRYVTLQFSDPDSHIGGITSFRVENKDVSASVVQTLAQKAGLVPYGELFVRPTASGAATNAQSAPAVVVENELLSGRVISLPRAVYPPEARQAGVTGTVRVLVTVDEQGNAAEAEAISGPPMLQAAAVDAARRAKFEPVAKDGHPVRAKTVIAYNF